ncbi:MAG: HAMP domain-containing histidine kinase [Clostridiales bacterium]|nr:HAMP domain-containing histidine kinase [Clostridiales bacterium]
MIKSLRRKFILIAMSAIIIVLGAIVSVINVINYNNVNDDARQTLRMIAENGGVYPDSPASNRQEKSDKDDNKESAEDKGSTGDKSAKNSKISKNGKSPSTPDLSHNVSPEAPFATRYFTVTLSSDGSVSEVDVSSISAISADEAVDITLELTSEQKTDGFVGNYKYTTTSADEGVMYIFLDCTSDLATFHNFLWVSIATSAGGLVLVFVLVMIFSRIALKPVFESYEKQRRFITDASHELKTPLTIIDANTEVLEMENGSNEWTESTKNQVKRLTALTEKLVFLSRMDEKQTVYQMINFSLSDAVSETAQPFESVAVASGKSFAMDIEKDIVYCGDESSLRHMVSLLLDNAMKYSDDEGNIVISLKSSGKDKIITVSNTVDEIKKGNLDVLFECFYRMDSSRSTRTGGTGIGLSVVKAIVTTHKGKITAKSEDGKSIVFRITL